MAPNERQQIDALKARRAQLATPAERIAFDNDPANGPVALRLIAMVESGGANSDSKTDLFSGLSARLISIEEARMSTPAIAVHRCRLLHSDLGVWSADASDLGLSPGQWPAEIEVENENGSHTRYRFPFAFERDGEVTHVQYRTAGSMLVIYND